LMAFFISIFPLLIINLTVMSLSGKKIFCGAYGTFDILSRSS
jgi:hypothetical protein